jgi:glycosyltransferase involved in cell wall biosynthesis
MLKNKPPARRKVVMFVRNNCQNDARVLKEAKSLVDNGYWVRIIATLTETDVLQEVRDGIIITRVPVTNFRNPFLRLIELIIMLVLRTMLFFIERPMMMARSRVKKVARPVFADEEETRVIERIREIFAFYGRSLSRAVRDRADVYHGHDLSALWPAYLAAKLTRGKVVYDSHELFAERNTAYKEGFLIKSAIQIQEKFLLRRVDRVITVNESIAKELQFRYQAKRKPDVVMNCPSLVITERTDLLRTRLNLSLDIPIILYIGGITFNRGLEQTIESLQYLKGPIFVMLGPGKLGFINHLREHAKTFNVSDRVIFAPPVPHNEVASYASSADVSVAPIQNVCLSYYYCSPNKLFESIMAGLPVAASDFPEMRAVIEADQIGAVFDPAKPKEIAAAIEKILSDREAYELMRKHAYRAAAKYSWEKESTRLLEIYRELAPTELPVAELV